MSKNSLCHFEVMSKDTKKAGDFYSQLFDWKLNFDMGEDYIMFQPESGVGGGIQKIETLTPGGGLRIYIYVEDIDAYIKKAVDLGGKQVTPKTDIPNVGWYGEFSDLDGNIIGLFTGRPGS
jgi:predicted enzyme related to lactoylglutathione lyase